MTRAFLAARAVHACRVIFVSIAIVLLMLQVVKADDTTTTITTTTSPHEDDGSASHQESDTENLSAKNDNVVAKGTEAEEKPNDNLPSKGISHEINGDNLNVQEEKPKTGEKTKDEAAEFSGEGEKDTKHDYAKVEIGKESSEYSGDSAPIEEPKSDNLPVEDGTSEQTADVDMGDAKAPFSYLKYQPYDKIVQELKRIEKKDDKEIKKTMFSIGSTFQKRTLWAIRLEHKTSDKPMKKTIFIDCGAHAREWIAPSTCMWLINELTSSKGSMRDLLKKYNWVFVPLLNPDGYAFTWEKDNMRLWRKNRSFDDKQLKKYRETDDPMCIGVDINRNFNKTWGGVGAATDNPCDETYAGSEPFSEKESTALSKYLKSVENDVIAYVTLHCYGQLWMTPWGHTSKKPRDVKELTRVAELAVESMKKESGVNYTVGSSHDILYSHSGTSVDWVYSKLQIPYSYVVEMIPKEDNAGSFDLPANAMVKNAKDMVVGIRTMAENLKEDQENHSDGFDKTAAKVVSAVRDALKAQHS